MTDSVKIIECPRDAMQGLHDFVPTQLKTEYLNLLLKVGFDTLDFGSFVSPKAIPQMSDTAAVLAGLDTSLSTTRLLAIVANKRGADTAVSFEAIDYLGFPLSVSETFQVRNTNKHIAEALDELRYIQDLCATHQKQLVVYLSMGFGNPYGDEYSPQLVVDFTGQLDQLGVRIVAPSDTVGAASPTDIRALFEHLIPAFPYLEFGAHLHATPDAVADKVAATVAAGVRRIDGALRGFGGCPMAKDDLTGNLPTERVLSLVEAEGFDCQVDKVVLAEALLFSQKIFS
jgi:hydroxymethylglutaryl-CoA lyase